MQKPSHTRSCLVLCPQAISDRSRLIGLAEVDLDALLDARGGGRTLALRNERNTSVQRELTKKGSTVRIKLLRGDGRSRPSRLSVESEYRPPSRSGSLRSVRSGSLDF